MIERIVLIKLTEEHTTASARAVIAEESRRRLGDVLGPIGVTVATPADDKASDSWDLAITVRFEVLDDVPGYLADPLHRAYVDEYLLPKVACLKAWNFERP
jgi:hypothetical protein